MNKLFLSFLLVTFSTGVFAECSGQSCHDVTITRLYVTPNGQTFIGTSGDESKLSCNAGNYGYITLEVEQKNYDATYSLLLAAHINQHPIWVKTSSDSNKPCNVVYVVSDK